MPRVVVEDVLASILAAWPTTGLFAAVPCRANAKLPNETADTYAILTGRETQPAAVESDGLCQQTFSVSVQVHSSCVPPITQAISQGLSTIYDGTKSAPNAGLTLASPARVTRCDPAASSSDRDPTPRAGNDALVVLRSWQIVTETQGG